MLISAGLGGVVLHQDSMTRSALQLKRDIAIGEKISRDDVQVVGIPRIESASSLLTDVSQTTEFFAAHTLSEGALLRSADVTETADTQSVVSVQIPETSLPPRIAVGSDIDVWQVSDAAAHVIVANVVVRDIVHNERSATATIAIALEPALAGQVLAAGDAIRITLKR